MAVSYKPAVSNLRRSDLLACWRLDQRCFEGTEAYDIETFRYLLDHPSTVGFKVAVPNDRMIGFVIGMIEPEQSGHVIALAIAPAYRRQGFGRLLMDQIEDAFRCENVRIARLEVRVGNDAAECLYLALDYRPVRTLHAYYSNGENATLMTKDLWNDRIDE